ncbi:MAG: DNA-binding protein [Pirellulaceae bacterium]
MHGILRFVRGFPCPVCGGHERLAQGKGTRCYGYLAADQRMAFCTRKELATENTPFNDGANAYQHWLGGPCACGTAHRLGDEPVLALGRLTEIAPAASAEVIDAVLRRYLGLLTLEEEERTYLLNRGPDELEVALAHGYVSAPRDSWKSATVIQPLVNEFGEETLLGVPGFKKRKTASGVTVTVTPSGCRGFLIPGRDFQGRLLGYQLRVINGDVRYQTACGAKSLYTVTGSWSLSDENRPLYIVEGLHKAHVAAQRGGFRVLGLPGVHPSESALATIRDLAPSVVIEAFDADKFVNDNVRKSRNRLIEQLKDLGYEIQTAVWEHADGKGLDDLLLGGGRPRLRSLVKNPEITGRRPRPAPVPLRAHPGLPVQEAAANLRDEIRGLVRSRSEWRGKISVVAAPPGLGKSHVMAETVKDFGVAARIVTGTVAQAQELGCRFDIPVAAARSSENCENFAAVEASRKANLDVSSVVCSVCPWREACRTKAGGYYYQFEQSGPMVGTTEMLFSRSFMAAGDLVVLDDAELIRALVDVRSVNLGLATNFAGSHHYPSIKYLMKIVCDAIIACGALEGVTKLRPAIGPAAWDILARCASSAEVLAGAVRDAANCMPDLRAEEQKIARSAEDIEARPPAVLAMLVATLIDELPAFEARTEFNSRITLNPDHLEVRGLRPPLLSQTSQRPLLLDRAVLVLDATPLNILYERLAPGLQIREIYQPDVAMPQRVGVVQYADHFWGKSSIRPKEAVRRALVRQVDRTNQAHLGSAPAAVVLKDLRGLMAEIGIPAERTLNFYGLRGQNMVEDADRLYLVGRPQLPDYAVIQLANVLHMGELPIDRRMILRPERYDGYVAADGHGREIDVVDFVDDRASAILRAGREHEMFQAIHRARPLRVGLRGSQGDDLRSDLLISIHTAEPIPGIPVDDLIYDQTGTKSWNMQSHDEARERVLEARDWLVAQRISPTTRAIAEVAGASQGTVVKVLREEREQLSGRPLSPAIDTLNSGVKQGARPMDEPTEMSIPEGKPRLVDIVSDIAGVAPSEVTPSADRLDSSSSDKANGQNHECDRHGADDAA